jgi:hypothetical protein
MSVASVPGLLAPASISVAFGVACLAAAVQCAAPIAARLSPLAANAEAAKTTATFLRISIMSILSWQIVAFYAHLTTSSCQYTASRVILNTGHARNGFNDEFPLADPIDALARQLAIAGELADRANDSGEPSFIAWSADQIEVRGYVD